MSTEDDRRLMGLKYARGMGFADSVYHEALKSIQGPNWDHNQLLKALLKVGSPAPDANIGQQQASDNNLILFESCPSSRESTSCYSSNPSSASSLDHFSQLEGPQLRDIFIDGSNVARTHGKNLFFSWPGIKICVDWFHNRHHRVKVFVPDDKCHTDANADQQQKLIIAQLNKLNALVQTPAGHNDDYFIIEAARPSNGIIVSNDLFRDEKRYDEELKEFIRLHRLPYIFVDDLFIPAQDPLGRSRRPFLDEFLKVGPSQSNNLIQQQQRFSNSLNHKKLDRAKSYQRYPQRNDSLNSFNNTGRNKTPLHRAKSHTG